MALAPKTIEPVLGRESYSCPHCGAIAHQDWFELHATAAQSPPSFVDLNHVAEVIATADPQMRAGLEDFIDKKLSYEIFFSEATKDLYNAKGIVNLTLSRCYSCERLTLWQYDKILWPETSAEISPSGDMPSAIVPDFKEAVSIVEKSPRGAAALLRLCLQKLCAHLGEKGKSIDDDIASLVRKGLDSRIQRALDVVRVIGNEAVHPGAIDLHDDRATAMELFGLINYIVEAMITQPKRVDDLYSRLPQSKLKAIERRDARSKESGAD
jgi:hypothetical protein